MEAMVSIFPTALSGLNGSPSTGEESGGHVKSDVLIIYDLRMMGHKTCQLEEVPERISKIIEKLSSDGLLKRCKVVTKTNHVDPKYAREAHSEDYMKFIEALPRSFSRRSCKEYVGSDVYCSDGTKDAILLAAGAVVQACHEVAAGTCLSAFAIVRPPGHHASKEKASGFCFLNNVAIGAKYLQAEFGVKRILIVDFDVHHGDGTQDIFYNDKNVLFVSVHRSALFPESMKKVTDFGNGAGKRYTINVNLKYIEDNDLLAVWEHVLLPVATQFAPEYILVSCGFDAALGDPLGRCGVTSKCFGQLVLMLKEINNKVVLVLEGGYNLEMISEASSQCIMALLGDTQKVVDQADPFTSTMEAIIEVRNEFKEPWTGLAAEIDPQIVARCKPDPKSEDKKKRAAEEAPT
uniref:Rpd3 n=1 Tax=Arundo donax TaxID=35708 RepID=A0A0A9GSX0_ARUDO